MDAGAESVESALRDRGSRPVRSRARVAAALGVLLAAGAAVANPLADARRHYRRLEYDQALLSLAAARRTAVGAQRLAETSLLEAQIFVALERNSDALAAFRAALRLVPTLRPAADESPKIVAVFEQALRAEQERRRRRQEVRVELQPPLPMEVAERGFDVGARVERGFAGLTGRLQVVDAAGATAATLALTSRGDGHWSAHVPADLVRPAATLQLLVELLDEGEVIATAPADGKPLALLLPSRRAGLRITTPSSVGDISIDGRWVGRAPLAELIAVEPGRRRVALRSRAGSIEQEVQIAAGDVAMVSLNADNGPARRAIARVSLLGVGGLMLLAGTGLAIAAGFTAQDAESTIRRESASGLPTTDYSAARGYDTAGRAEAACAIAGFVVGGAALVTGALLFIPGRRAHRDGPRVQLDARGLRF